MQQCTCGNEKPLTECCDRFISGQALPKTPEELMRSRYTAYTQADTQYIQDTMQPPAATGFDPEAVAEWAESVKWIGLDVIESGENGDEGWVEFIAFFEEEDGELAAMQERSKFKRVDGKWFYVDEEEPKHTHSDGCGCGEG